MNTAIHDVYNLAWKLNLAIRGLASPGLLPTFEDERRQVIDNLIDYDHEHIAALTSGSATAYAENSLRNARFASGYGADYAPNLINMAQKGSILGALRVGSLLPPAKVTRFVDSAPVDIQLDVPALGQFRLLFFTKSVTASVEFLNGVSAHALSESSALGKASRAANESYCTQPPFAAVSDDYVRPERYTTVSGLFTYGIVLQMRGDELELSDLPTLWRESRWTVYLDEVPHLDTRGMTCTEKWLGGVSGSEVAVVVIRPDGVVGTIIRGRGTKEHAAKACQSLDSYFSRFLNV